MASLPSNISLRHLGRIIRGAVAFAHPDPTPDPNNTNPNSPHTPANPNQPTPPPDFESDSLALFRLLHNRNIPHLLVGGIALLRYVRGRNTDDIDLILNAADLPRLPEFAITDRNNDFAAARFRSLRVDLCLTTNPVFALALNHHATAHNFAELAVPCATPAGLILLKLYALPSLYRQHDLARAALYENDILMLMQAEHADPDPLLAALRPTLAPADITELQAIIAEIRTRLARMRRE
ncbi:MAG: hypothetical protein R3B68_07890 [Phycisphaerales bacterium]